MGPSRTDASKIKSVKDLAGKSIATELVHFTRNYLKENGVEAEVEFFGVQQRLRFRNWLMRLLID